MNMLEDFLSELRQRDVTLWLDEERLRYRAPEGSLAPEELAELRNRKAEIIEFLKAAKQLSSHHQLPLQPVSREAPLPLSFAQQRFWFLYQFEPDSPANNMPVVVRFKGNLRLDVLKRSIAEVVRRHEVLRSRFPTVDGQPVLVIEPELEVELPIVDLQDISDDQRDAETHRVATKDARQPFDLETGPLLRVTLFRLTEQEHLLLWNIPCIICDGTSSDLFYRELTTCYVAYAKGISPDLPDLPIQCADVAHWQRHYLQGEVLESHLIYWKQQLNDSLTPLQLPIDYPRAPGLRTCRGDRYARMLSKSLHQALLTLSQQLGTTLFVVLLATFDVLLHRYSQQDDVLTTFVSSGRNRVETENLIGFFSNTLILRTHFDQDLTFRELVQRIHHQNLDAYIHQEMPFERLIDALSPEQRQGRSPLFQTKFTLNPPWTNGQGMAPITLPDLEIESLFGFIYHGKTKYDLILVTREQDQGLGAVIDYNAELFRESTIERMMDHIQTLLEYVVVNPDQAIAALPLLPAAEQKQLIEWSQTAENLSEILAQATSSSSFKADGLVEPGQEHLAAYVLDRYLQPVPIGVVGELYIAVEHGNQLAIESASQNGSRSILEPLTKDYLVTLHSTGLSVRYLPDGRLELDSSCLNGAETNASTAASTTFRDEIERELTEIWQRVLGIESIGIQDNFFDLGGQSLLAVRLFAQIEEVFGKRLPLSALLQSPTIALLANLLRQDSVEEDWSPLVLIQAGDQTKLPLFCVHGGGFNVLVYRDLAMQLDPSQPVYGLQARGLGGENIPIRYRLEDMATDYIQQIRTVQPKGPYYLCGLSNGGNIAFEMAQQLIAQGEKIAFLGMFDAYGPNAIRLLPPFNRLLSSFCYVWRYSLPRSGSKLKVPGLTRLLQLTKSVRIPQQWHLNLEPKQTNRSLAKFDDSSALASHSILSEAMDRLSDYILKRSPWSFFTPQSVLADYHDSTSTILKQLEKNYQNSYKVYVHENYPGKVSVFRAEESPPGYFVDFHLGWDTLAEKGVELYVIPGHHTSIMSSPVLAAKVKECLAKAVDFL